MMKPKNLFIYHEGTGTLIALSDKVYLIDADLIDSDTLDDLEMGANVTEREHLGRRIDNYNMTNLFFGGAE
jgi:hypothetical protein